MESSEAILMRRIRFSETSLIVTWLTRQHGKVKTIAKGALRPKSLFWGKLDLFFEAEIGYLRSRKSEIHTLREVVLRNPYEGVRTDYRRVELASYFSELLDIATELEAPVPELFDLLQRGLRYLHENPPTRKAHLYFEKELARLLGIEGGGNPAESLRGALHRLPEGRGALLEKWE